MTKQEARKLIVSYAKHFKRLGFGPGVFKDMLNNKSTDAEFIEAYQLIENEMVHVYAVVWGWDR